MSLFLFIYFFSVFSIWEPSENLDCFKEILKRHVEYNQSSEKLIVIQVSGGCGYCAFAINDIAPIAQENNTSCVIVYANQLHSEKIDQLANKYDLPVIKTESCLNEKILTQIVPQIWIYDLGEEKISYKFKGWKSSYKKKLLKKLY